MQWQKNNNNLQNAVFEVCGNTLIHLGDGANDNVNKWS